MGCERLFGRFLSGFLGGFSLVLTRNLVVLTSNLVVLTGRADLPEICVSVIRLGTYTRGVRYLFGWVLSSRFLGGF